MRGYEGYTNIEPRLDEVTTLVFREASSLKSVLEKKAESNFSLRIGRHGKCWGINSGDIVLVKLKPKDRN